MNQIPDIDQIQINAAKSHFKELCYLHDALRAKGYDVTSVVGLKNPASFSITKTVKY